MSWAEIKHAVNSTIGTDEFKSLDKIFEGNWRLIASDNAYISITPGYTSNSSYNTYTISNSFKTNVNGTAKFTADAIFYDDATYSFNLIINGVKVASHERSGTEDAKLTFSVEHYISVGDVITFTFTKTSGSGRLSEISRLAILGYPIYAPELIESL